MQHQHPIWQHGFICMLLFFTYSATVRRIIPDPAVQVNASSNGATAEVAEPPSERLFFFISIHERGVSLAQVERQLQSIYYPEHMYLYHVDTSSGAGYFNELASMLEKYGKHGVEGPNCVVMEASRMGWGGFNTVSKTIEAMKAAFQTEHPWDFFINLSGADYPVKPIPELVAFLSKHPNKNFVQYGAFPPTLSKRLHNLYVSRADGVVIPCDRLRTEQTFVDLKHFKVDRDYPVCVNNWALPEGYQPYKGSAWMTLSRSFCDYLTSNIISLLPLVLYSASIAASDEFFFPTVLFNSAQYKDTSMAGNISHPKNRLCGYRENSECGSNLRYILFNSSAHPKVLNLGDLETIDAMAMVYWVRKVLLHDPLSKQLIDLLDSRNAHAYYKPAL